MKESIISLFESLGGKFEDKASSGLVEQFSKLRFPLNSQYREQNLESLHLFEEFYYDNEELFKESNRTFNKELKDKFFPKGECVYAGRFMTRFHPKNEKFGSEEHEVIALYYGVGFPDEFWIKTDDKDPENPTVYASDHETRSEGLKRAGSLESFLQSFVSTKDALARVKKHLKKGEFLELPVRAAKVLRIRHPRGSAARQQRRGGSEEHRGSVEPSRAVASA